MLPHLGAEDVVDLDARLASRLDEALEALEGKVLKATSRGSAEALRAARGIIARGGRVPWPLWARLSKPEGAKADLPAFELVARVASHHPGHTRLRADLERFIRLSFRCAAEAMDAFQAAKAERGVLDFADQETFALRVLQNPDNLEKLRERIEVVFVDEMQDSSPVQVALFTALAKVARRSVWVGDPKQSIFGFRSADPQLTLAAAQGAAAATGGSIDVLSTSWRSRPGIRSFINACFVPAFGNLGLNAEETAFSTHGRSDSTCDQPCLATWQLQGKTKRDHADRIASGVASALGDAAAWPVGDGSAQRPLLPGDVAVLCRGNDDVEAVATSLTALGVPVSVALGDLFDTPEGQLARAALRWVDDRDDRLALAEMARLTGDPERPSAWLEALGKEDSVAALTKLVPFAATLDQIRSRRPSSMVGEMIDAVLVSGGVLDTVVAWGDAGARMLSLEAIRGLATRYQQCSGPQAPATLGGFVNWTKEREAKRPRSGAAAVHVITYHASKGLEWPLVVCCQLDQPPRASPFGIRAEQDGDVDWTGPLAGRWVRYWPWPYGQQSKDVHLNLAGAQSDVGRREALSAKEEAIRLLYVGMTRARDHLVLAVSPREQAWLRTLDTGSDPHVAIAGTDNQRVDVAGTAYRSRSIVIAPEVSRIEPACKPSYSLTTHQPVAFAPLRSNPSNALAEHAKTLRRHDLGGRILLKGASDMNLLGPAVHAFMAADGLDRDIAARRLLAETILHRWRVSGHVDPDCVVRSADRLRSWLLSRFDGARIRREVPVHAALGKRIIVGRIDLLIEGVDWFVIVDHKTFPGGIRLQDEKAKAHAAQLALYAEAVGTVSGRRCRGLFIHLPIVGAIIEVESAASESFPRPPSRDLFATA